MSKWIPSWRYVPIDYNQEVGVFENITQRSVFLNNLAGDRIRVRFNNLYSDEPMRIDHAAVAVRNRVTGKLSARCPVTLAGEETILLPGNSQPYSDEIALQVTPEDDFLVYLYFGHRTVIRSVCTTSAAYSWQSTHHTGNFHETDALGFTVKPQLVPVLAADPYPNQFTVGLCEISVLTGDNVKLVGLFGDSITHMSFFSDPFTAMLYRRFPGQYSVMNAGIAGNRIQKTHPAPTLMPGEGHQFGIAGKDRFRKDLYDGAAPDVVFVMEGVNDCSHSIVFGEPQVPTAQDIFDALADVTRQAHAMGSRVLISTVSPFGAFGDAWRDRAEALRCGYNELIRASRIAEGVVDMDAALRDPEDPHRMQEGMHLGDGVHPNWFGGTKMARTLLAFFPEA